MKKLSISVCLLLSVFLTDIAIAQSKATWIWYPGDFEIWLGNKMQNRRTERGSFFPPFWRMDSHYVLMDFHKVFDLSAPEEVMLYAEGAYNVKLDSKMLPGRPQKVTIPAGKHRLNIKVYNQEKVPAIFVQGKTVISDSTWKVTYEDKEWIDATGMVSSQSGTQWLNAGSWNFDDPQSPPSGFKLNTQPQSPAHITRAPHSLTVDFGKETFGFIKLHGLKGTGPVAIYYGESLEEAQATATCETMDQLDINQPAAKDSTMPLSKAFRYVHIQYDANVQIDSVSMLYEFLPVANRGSFRCSDEELNKIWDVAAYTLHLNTREFFIDGIKRDRWIWSGDAYQSFLMNYYLFFDSPTVSRTLLALRGKDPVSSHINTIMDYTFYWFLGIYDYYLYTGDQSFIQQFYPRMQSLIDFCLQRRNKDGMLEGQAGDWVFIDWADGLSKQGEVSFEQLLFCRSLETMALCADIVKDGKGAAQYKQLATDLRAKLFDYYWDANKQGLVHSRINGKPTSYVTRYTNMFSIFFDYLNEAQKQGVKQHVLLNDSVQQITTPYMRFYELEALCAMGEQDYVLKEMKDYWGGMLKLGATSFWEKYDPKEKGAEHYAMYGRPFGRSLCHAWGASPIYLLGKYYLGVKPTSPGYQTYSITPVLGGLQWMEGAVPTPNGDITIHCSTKQIKVKAAQGKGILYFHSKTKPVCAQGTVMDKGNNAYEMQVEQGRSYEIKYVALK
ncbi:Bacterial alpha-L-rhamnosidase [Chitinophaga agrisoli]|uniref:Bacterial alpha-L-rhamnosidase n=1 Tax=Chitinophaga agrisoli TaxID=2607653 RepID=A0A5B2VQ38_9BACT|nr:alpha-L-rhamnosidase C-terminal domain-containing protein [Chitinophaga agrisoli]KAA2240788.1 Bacterial alpha-L-rhamnosidase [Chitinophaga agrisoli]